MFKDIEGSFIYVFTLGWLYLEASLQKLSLQKLLLFIMLLFVAVLNHVLCEVVNKV